MLEKLKSIVFGPPERRAEQCYQMGMKELERGRQHFYEFHFKSAVKLVPSSAKYRTAYGNALMMKGDLEEAISEFRNALATGERSALLMSNLGVALRMTGRIDEAAEMHVEAVKLCGDDAETLINAAATFQQHQGPEAAVLILRRVLQFDPNNVDAHYNLANMEGLKSGEQEYLTHLEVASSKDSYRTIVLLLKGAYLITKGRSEEAASCVSEVLEMDPECCAHIELDDRFRTLRDLSIYQKFLTAKPRTMYTCLVEAECAGDMENVARGEKKSLVVLAFGRHPGEARDLACAALETVGWANFDLSSLMPAQREGLRGLGAAANQGWELAEKNGAHVFVF